MASDITLTELGLEQIARKTLLTLYSGLNDSIDAVNTLWATRDATFWAALGETDPDISAEHVPSGSFYTGHIPSLIDAPVEKYPNIAVIAYSSMPGSSQDDSAEQRPTTVAVELMVKSQIVPDDKEYVAQLEVNARCLRTMEAVHSVLLGARTLGNTVPSFSATPTVQVSDAFVRRVEKSRGDRWFWQGARLEYIVQKYQSY